MRTGGGTSKIPHLVRRMIYRVKTGWSLDERLVVRKVRRLEL